MKIGEIIYEYAAKYPYKVKSLTFLDVAPNNIEFYVPFVLNNWSQSQLDGYKKSELNKRNQLFGLINGLGVPWGLMSLVLPVTKANAGKLTVFQNNFWFLKCIRFFWIDNAFVDFVRWNFLTEKTWITQGFI